MIEFDTKKSNVFISYSWDGKAHQKWILELAKILEMNSFHVIYDQEHLKIGMHKYLFMEKCVKGSDFVLIVLTPKYKHKADSRKGGAGYEYSIINHRLFEMLESNNKFLPVLRAGSESESIPEFLKAFMYIDLRPGKEYEIGLSKLIKQIRADSQKKPRIKTKSMENSYITEDKVIDTITNNFDKYFTRVFDLEEKTVFAGQGMIKLSLKEKKEKISNLAEEWEDEVSEYSGSFHKYFNEQKLEAYSEIAEDFRTKTFATKLWTVKSALKTRDPDLARFKKDFNDSDGEEILQTVKDILTKARNYVAKESSKIDYSKLSSTKALHLDFLNDDRMLMKKIIGFGIRSEILHRYFPGNFPIMTQKSLWGMYFLSDNLGEFIKIEKKQKQEKMRVSHNWQYDYLRFTYINNHLVNIIKKQFDKVGLQLNESLRFGYANMFLSAVRDLHYDELKELHEWSDEEK